VNPRLFPRRHLLPGESRPPPPPPAFSTGALQARTSAESSPAAAKQPAAVRADNHFSIQQDHGHFIVEGDEARRARGGMHGLAIRLALAVNRALGRRKGKVVADRYHV